MEIKRVVVTGLGLVSPLGVGVKESWRRLLNSESGVKKVVSFDVSDIASKIAGQIPAANVEQKGDVLFDPMNYVSSKEYNKMDLFIVYAIAAANEAISDAGIDNLSDEDKERAGVLIGAGIGGVLSQVLYTKTIWVSILLLAAVTGMMRKETR